MNFYSCLFPEQVLLFNGGQKTKKFQQHPVIESGLIEELVRIMNQQIPKCVKLILSTHMLKLDTHVNAFNCLG